jgi:hypothetical protein
MLQCMGCRMGVQQAVQCMLFLTRSLSRDLIIAHSLVPHGSRDSSVGIATGCGLDGRNSIPGRGKIFSFSTASIPALGTIQPPIQWVPLGLSAGVERPGREADHSHSSSAVVKNG